MLGVSRLRKIWKSCVSFVENGIDYACYVMDEFRNKQSEDWGDGVLPAITEDMKSHPAAKHSTSTGKINLRINTGENEIIERKSE